MGKWSVVGFSMGRWLVDLIKARKNMFGIVISPVHIGRGLLCYSNFNFFILIKKKQIWLPEVITRIFNYSLR